MAAFDLLTQLVEQWLPAFLVPKLSGEYSCMYGFTDNAVSFDNKASRDRKSVSLFPIPTYLFLTSAPILFYPAGDDSFN